MTPLTPNPQGPKSLQQGQNDVSPVNQDCPVLFNFLDQFQENDHVSKDHKPVLHYGGSSSSINPQQLYNQSSDSAMVDQSIARDNILPSSMEVEDSTKRKDPMEAKWVASKMRLMKILMIPERSYGAAKKEDKAIIKKATASDATTPPSNGGFQNEMYQGSPTARVCVECQATSTPLWRSGPKGPKSLCNACGIRQRKARRAEAEAGSSLATSTKIKGHDNEKEKKLSVKKCTQFKKKNKTTPTAAAATADSSSSDEMTERLNFFLLKVRKKSGYEDTTEEVADTALLLMDISCGYVYP